MYFSLIEWSAVIDIAISYHGVENHTEVSHVFSHDSVHVLPVVLIKPPLSDRSFDLRHALPMKDCTVFQ